MNLSARILNEHEISLLSKGLKFCPTPRELDRSEIKRDLEAFGRRMRLKWHFRDEEDTIPNPFRPKSKYNPRNESVYIEMYLSCVEEAILNISGQGKNVSNLSK